MEFALQHKDELISMYNNGESTYSIAKKLCVPQSRVRKALIFLGVRLRNYSEAQSLALESGRIAHPTKGKERPENVKNLIGKSNARAWQRKGKEDREEFIKKKREYWKSLSEFKKKEIQHLAAKAVRRAAEVGSRAEIYVRDTLMKEGWEVEHHIKGRVKNQNLEIDLYLPEVNAVVEIDGPSHFLPIWGEDRLRKQVKSDNVKNGLLLSSGYNIIRIRHLDDNITVHRLNIIVSAVKEAAYRIKMLAPTEPIMIDMEVANGKIRKLS